MRFLKKAHWENPMTWPPERATRSLVSSPCLLKLLISAGKSMNGVGMLLLASVLLAVVESLLPSGTVHDGPPSFTIQKIPHELPPWKVFGN